MAAPEERFKISTDRGPVTGAWARPAGARAVLVVAHGAGGTLDHAFLVGCTRVLNDRGVGTLRFNFLYSESGRRSPDPEQVLRETWLSAFDAAVDRSEGHPVFVGGKSLGGRIASMCVADGMPAAGLVLLGYPLHAPGKPEKLRDEHLDRIEVPMLFLQGTADPFAKFDLLEGVVDRLGANAALHRIEGGDHSFRGKGRPQFDRDVGAELGRAAASWILKSAGGG